MSGLGALVVSFGVKRTKQKHPYQEEKEYLKDFSTVNHLFKAPKGDSTAEREQYLMDGGEL